MHRPYAPPTARHRPTGSARVRGAGCGVRGEARPPEGATLTQPGPQASRALHGHRSPDRQGVPTRVPHAAVCGGEVVRRRSNLAGGDIRMVSVDHPLETAG